MCGPRILIANEPRRGFEAEPYGRHQQSRTKRVSSTVGQVCPGWVVWVNTSATCVETVLAHLCRCWVAPTVHILLKDPVLSSYVAEKLSQSPSSHVQLELLRLAEQFVQHSRAVCVEALLDALAHDTPELLRVDAKGKRKTVQAQLDWFEALGYILGALTTPLASAADEVPFQTCLIVCTLVPHIPEVHDVQRAWDALLWA